LSPEICIVVDDRITASFFSGGKADAVNEAEGSSPGHAKASEQDTTGVEEQGMSSKGVAWELGRATCLLDNNPETAYRVTKQARR